VQPGAADEGCGGMTAAAIQTGGKMWRIGLGILTGGGHAVTRITAGPCGHRTMIECRRFEGGGVMANTTILIGRYMEIDFTPREEAIMAGLAIIHDSHMGKSPRDKTSGQVTYAAIIIGRHVGTVFAFCDHPVVTSGTTTIDASVIILGTGKGRSIVTYRTIFSGRQMIIGLDSRDRHTAIVTRGTIIYDTLVTEHCGFKTTGNVTDTAILGGRHVTGILLGRCTWRTITMTFCAVIYTTCMIKDTVSKVGTDSMASTAIGDGIGMRRRWCFAQRSGRCYKVAIVARSTVTRDAGMREYLWRKRRVGMTEMTILKRWQMADRFEQIWFVG
jgi:hypothetical protein